MNWPRSQSKYTEELRPAAGSVCLHAALFLGHIQDTGHHQPDSVMVVGHACAQGRDRQLLL